MGNVYVIELLLNSWIDFDGIMCLSAEWVRFVKLDLIGIALQPSYRKF